MTLPWCCIGCGATYYGEGAAAGCCDDGEAFRTPSGPSNAQEFADHDAMRRREYLITGRTSGGKRL